MTQQLLLAGNLVPSTFVFGHLQIVYEDDAGNLFENETTSPGFPYFFGDWAFPAFGRVHDDPNNTPGYGNPQDYSSVALDLRPGQTAEHVWELMGQIHASLSTGGHGLDYDIRQNSNSYVTSVLSVVGLNIFDYLPAATPPDVDGYPGVETNIFYGAKTGGLFSGYDTPIPLTLAGTSGNDYIVTGIGNDNLSGGMGRDFLNGGARHDRLSGGFDRDTLDGGDGNDHLDGGRGRDRLLGGRNDDLLQGGFGHDNLRGGKGNDTLEGGAHNDRLSGGKNADTFIFADGFGNDTITHFDALDAAEKIDLSGVTAITDFADLTDVTNPHVAQEGANVVIDDFAGNTITILRADLGEFDDSDFIFV